MAEVSRIRVERHERVEGVDQMIFFLSWKCLEEKCNGSWVVSNETKRESKVRRETCIRKWKTRNADRYIFKSKHNESAKKKSRRKKGSWKEGRLILLSCKEATKNVLNDSKNTKVVRTEQEQNECTRLCKKKKNKNANVPFFYSEKVDVREERKRRIQKDWQRRKKLQTQPPKDNERRTMSV